VLVSIAIEPYEHYNQPAVRVTATQSSHPLVASLSLFYERLSEPGRAILVKIAELCIQTVESQPFAENTYIAYRSDQTDCIVVDPGFEPEKVLAILDREQLVPVAILNTHGHSDHIAGNQALKQRWSDIPLIIGQDDADKLTDPEKNLSAPFGVELRSPPADELVKDGQVLSLAGMDWTVCDTPGHSRGHVVFIYQARPVIVLGGDVLFQGSIGRTDFPDGDMHALVDSIHQKLFTLPDDSIVLPGHGPPTTIGQEKRTNPFVGVPAGYPA